MQQVQGERRVLYRLLWRVANLYKRLSRSELLPSKRLPFDLKRCVHKARGAPLGRLLVHSERVGRRLLPVQADFYHITVCHFTHSAVHGDLLLARAAFSLFINELFCVQFLSQFLSKRFKFVQLSFKTH